MNKILEVRDLKISFRTSGGMVQAVRNISFDLYKGETLAIVGESGSGKSVTSRAIMGISAVNAVTESGEILYDGSDLLKFSETDFQEIRGNKIAMIFQDPMSSLNPIVRIGKQLTEAMILKNRVDRRRCRRAYREKLRELRRSVASGNSPERKSEFSERIRIFERAESEHIRLENRYNLAREAAEDAAEKLEKLLVAIEKKPDKTVLRGAQEIARRVKRSFHEDLIPREDSEVSALTEILERETPGEKLTAALVRLSERLDEALKEERPDFFARGYALVRGETDTETAFLTEFQALLAVAAEYSFRVHTEEKHKAIAELEAALPVLDSPLDAKTAKPLFKRLGALAESGVDRLDVERDSREYTFAGSLRAFSELYFRAEKRNAKENRRFEKQSARRERAEARGKNVDWKVVPPALVDLDALRGKMRAAVVRLLERYREAFDSETKFDSAARASALFAFFQKSASGSVYRVTKSMAKSRAIRLMEEVGIPEPEKRYRQYPFQMSGGQRQRIVIAIALAANPDILICDEPTTALDVTIQSQILELINRVKRERGLSVIFITHDLGVVANMADRIAVMYAGKIVEYGTAEDVFYSPAHPYTWALLSSVPDLESKKKLEAIPGTPPNMIFPPKGDAFAERNRYALEIDFKEEPPMFQISETHGAATWLLHPMAPKVPLPRAVSERIERMKRAGGQKDE